MKSGKEHALSIYEDRFTGVAIEVLGKGKSYAALAAELGICLDTVETWRKKYPEFAYACKVGKAKGQAWWEENSDQNMENKDYSSVRYIFKMKSQYKVRDGTEGNKQDNQQPTAHILFGMEGDKHRDLVERIMDGNHSKVEDE